MVHIAAQETPAPAKGARGLLGRAVKASGRRAVRWVQQDTLRRLPHPIGMFGYGTGEALHLVDAVQANAYYGLGLTALGSIIAYARGVSRPGEGGQGGRAAVGTAAVGTWLTMAAAEGVTAGPYWAMSWAYAAAYGIAYWAYRSDEKVQTAIEHRERQTDWHIRASRYGLKGSHLLSVTETRLGERLLVDVVGTGRRASSIASSDLNERIAELEPVPLPASRVTVRPAGTAGRISINIRYRDPWENPLPHPLLDPNAEITLPDVADAREPIILGMDPDSGRPLRLPLYDEDGAKRALIVATTGGGKSVLLNSILERLTAADNTFTIGINLSKAKEMRRWAKSGALALNATGPKARIKTLRILELVKLIIDWRGAQDDDEVTVDPTHGRPLVTIVVDEMSTLLGVNDQIGVAIREALSYIMSKGRSEGVSVVLVGQRGTISQLGTTDIRTMLDYIVFLKINRRTEMMNAAGDLGLELPDMTRYGEGKPGVALVTSIDGDYETGRSWFLKELTDIERLATGRTFSPLEPELVEFLGDKLTRLLEWDEREAAKLAGRPLNVAPEPEDEQVDEYQDRSAVAAKQREDAKAFYASIPPLPEVTPEMKDALAAASAERRRQAGEQTEVTPEIRELALSLLEKGTTVRGLEVALEGIGMDRGTSRMGAWRILDKLRGEKVADLVGKGRAARWVLADPPDGSDVDDYSEQPQECPTELSQPA